MSMHLTPPMDFTSESMTDERISTQTPIRNFYRGKSIFLTGFTGFLGHLFAEKLLRCEVKALYILVRRKNTQTPRERMANYFSDDLFKKLLKTNPKSVERIKIIEGDCSADIDLGICDADQQELITSIEIIIHAAANICFDRMIENTCINNIRATRDLLTLADKMKNLEVFGYISTAFSQCPNIYIEEKFYKSPMDPDLLIKCVEQFGNGDSKLLNILCDKMIRPWPNVHTFSKALAENLFIKYSHKFSIAVIRPSIIISTVEDPIPAWCNNLYSLNGFLYAIGVGLLRVLPFKRDGKPEIICADYVINTTLAGIWDMSNDRKNISKLFQKKSLNGESNKLIKIYNVTSNQSNSTWGDMVNSIEKLAEVCPTENAIRHPYSYFAPCNFVRLLFLFWYHVIPGICFDMYLRITNDNRRLFPIYRKIEYYWSSIRYFVKNEWKFDRNNCYKLYDKISNEDKIYFPCDNRKFNFDECSYNYVLGLRKYIAKSKLDSIPAARKRYLKLKLMDNCLSIICYGIVYFLIFNYTIDIYQIKEFCKKVYY